ncbi:hypothetical protein NDU88_007309 [Pleurodeles waltl]|uniref:Uncharacterized protein n=1 Tax=Pleurodeles waltl TaxID=8319 RepID=A0AAV7WGZ7_PLEWA|nr:hypothetical protein NDU88_007309 [Pleurodeles waltl]
MKRSASPAAVLPECGALAADVAHLAGMPLMVSPAPADNANVYPVSAARGGGRASQRLASHTSIVSSPLSRGWGLFPKVPINNAEPYRFGGTHPSA